MFGRTKNTTWASPTTASANTTPSKTHALNHHLLRALQLLSALTSLILFSLRLAKILRLVHKASTSNSAVESIIAAAILYTLIATALSCGLRNGGSNMLRILLVVFDTLFVGAFIAVAILTSPKRHGSSGPCASNARANGLLESHFKGNVNCRLPWGTFILAIFSTVLHALTAAFHGAKDHRRTKRDERVVKNEEQHSGRDGFVDGNASVSTTGGSTRV